MKAFLFELCNDHKVNLYLDIDKEVNPDVYELFTKGMERIMNNEPMNYVLGYSYLDTSMEKAKEKCEGFITYVRSMMQ